MPFNADDVRAAAQRIAGQVVRTPMLKSLTLSQISGAEIWLKFENQQFTAAYKERGALNALLQLTQEQRERGVIAASAGNHSQGLSYHGTRLGVPVTIVMPRTTPTVKIMQTESVGGKVVLEGETFDDASAHARKLEKELGLTFVHPFDDPFVAAFLTEASIPVLRLVVALVALVVAGVPFLLLGLSIGYALSAKAATAIAQVVVFPLAFAGGLFMPPEAFPRWLDTLSGFLPSRAARDVVLPVATGGDVSAQAVVVLVAWTVVFAALVTVVYRRDEGRRFR